MIGAEETYECWKGLIELLIFLSYLILPILCLAIFIGLIYILYQIIKAKEWPIIFSYVCFCTYIGLALLWKCEFIQVHNYNDQALSLIGLILAIGSGYIIWTIYITPKLNFNNDWFTALLNSIPLVFFIVYHYLPQIQDDSYNPIFAALYIPLSAIGTVEYFVHYLIIAWKNADKKECIIISSILFSDVVLLLTAPSFFDLKHWTSVALCICTGMVASFVAQIPFDFLIDAFKAKNKYKTQIIIRLCPIILWIIYYFLHYNYLEKYGLSGTQLIIITIIIISIIRAFSFFIVTKDWKTLLKSTPSLIPLLMAYWAAFYHWGWAIFVYFICSFLLSWLQIEPKEFVRYFGIIAVVSGILIAGATMCHRP